MRRPEQEHEKKQHGKEVHRGRGGKASGCALKISPHNKNNGKNMKNKKKRELKVTKARMSNL